MATYSSGRTTADPRPLIPALGRYYGFTSDLAYLIVRVTVGLMLVPHGYTKSMTMGASAVATMLARYGIEPALPFAYIVIVVETIGGIMIAVGLLTRPVAGLAVIEFLVIIFVAHWPRGYSVSGGGIEFPLMWGLMLLAVALRGGGPWSVDRKLGWEV